MTYCPMTEYLLKKNSWTLELINLINWDKIKELMHDWQHTSDRKDLMYGGEANHTDRVRLKCTI